MVTGEAVLPGTSRRRDKLTSYPQIPRPSNNKLYQRFFDDKCSALVYEEGCDASLKILRSAFLRHVE
jgi:hypothetical protein